MKYVISPSDDIFHAEIYKLQTFVEILLCIDQRTQTKENSDDAE